MTKRFDRGTQIIERLYGDFGGAFFDDLEDIAPDFGRFIVEFSYGDVFSRPGLDMRTRELAIISALTALGTAERQLQAHILGALKVGASREEILEAIIQVAVYAGFPAGFNALMVAKRAFEDLITILINPCHKPQAKLSLQKTRQAIIFLLTNTQELRKI